MQDRHVTTILAPRTPMSPLSPAARSRASVSHGAALTFETVDAEAAPLRLRPFDDVLLRVIDGVVRLTTDAQERLLGTGDEAIVPAGEPHRIAGVAGQARLVMGFRAAGAA
jgi:mannose-6-phosphate isomerase-like protein (cupin superfamily)